MYIFDNSAFNYKNFLWQIYLAPKQIYFHLSFKKKTSYTKNICAKTITEGLKRTNRIKIKTVICHWKQYYVIWLFWFMEYLVSSVFSISTTICSRYQMFKAVLLYLSSFFLLPLCCLFLYSVVFYFPLSFEDAEKIKINVLVYSVF